MYPADACRLNGLYLEHLPHRVLGAAIHRTQALRDALRRRGYLQGKQFLGLLQVWQRIVLQKLRDFFEEFLRSPFRELSGNLLKYLRNLFGIH